MERQHRLIEELRLRSGPYVSAGELAETLGVTTRTVERDVAELQDAGVPVRARRGSGGGYGLDLRPALPPLTLTPGEAAVLVASLTAVGPRASATAQSVMGKLLDVMCDRRAAE
ncbi:helix-turn-helix transcriptional regulator [Actinomadura sp. 3N407]|uniref:helix-turn-helix transcriptional regulator n=1 Tax=Actinomadura sp. 3N407 TaxID=3457423 RepID=UPI003FCD4FA0